MEKLTKENGLVLNNYKEPLRRVAKPYYGYQGAILMTADGTKMQCHICGELFSNVAAHAFLQHKIKAKQYKEMFQLMSKTSLVSEQERERMKILSMKNWLSMSPFARQLQRKKFATFGKKGQKGLNKGKKHALEANNTKGTCPDQIADQIKKCAIEIGKTPSINEFIKWAGSARFVGLANYRFGSWKKAVKFTRLSIKKKKARNGLQIRHSRDELLDLLLIFWKDMGKVPTETDCRRGLLPHTNVFNYHFGSLPKARKLASINENVPLGRGKSTPFGNLQKTGYKTAKI